MIFQHAQTFWKNLHYVQLCGNFWNTYTFKDTSCSCLMLPIYYFYQVWPLPVDEIVFENRNSNLLFQKKQFLIWKLFPTYTAIAMYTTPDFISFYKWINNFLLNLRSFVASIHVRHWTRTRGLDLRVCRRAGRHFGLSYRSSRLVLLAQTSHRFFPLCLGYNCNCKNDLYKLIWHLDFII